MNEGIKDTMNEISEATRKPIPGEYPADPDVDVGAVIAARLKENGKRGWLLRKDPKALLPTWHKEFYAIKEGSLVRIGHAGGGSGSGSNSSSSSSSSGGSAKPDGAGGSLAAATAAAMAEKEEMICPLQLSTVRLYQKKDVSSRPFCFEVISPMSRVMLQACGTRDLEEWKLGLEGGIGKVRTDGRTEGM